MRTDPALLGALAIIGFAVGVTADRSARHRCDCASTRAAAAAVVPEAATAGPRRVGVPALLAGATTAAAWSLLGWRFGPSWTLAVGVVSSAGLVALSGTDIRCRRLPRSWCHLTALGAVAVMGAASVGTGHWGHLTGAFVSGTLAWCAFRGVWSITAQGRFGRGDVRLAFIVGACSGWVGTPRTAMLLGAMSLGAGCVGGLVTALSAVGRLRSTAVLVPLGPSLAGAALGTMLWGPAVLRLLGFA